MKIIVPLLAVIVSVVVTSYVAFAQEDLTPPALLDVKFEPTTIDTTQGPATITVTVHVTDDLSGVAHVALFFRRPGTTQTAQVEFREDQGWSEFIEGDELDGIHQATMTLPKFAAQGEWKLYGVMTGDAVGNLWENWNHSDDPEQTDAGWPSLFNGFIFAVGIAETPQQPSSWRLFMPTVVAPQ